MERICEERHIRWGIKYLTVYAFSTEAGEPKSEVDALMKLQKLYEDPPGRENCMKVRVIMTRLP